MIRRATRIVVTAAVAVAVAVSFAGPATAKPKKPKKITTEQLQALMLSPTEASQAAGSEVTLRDNKPAECFPQDPDVPCVVRYTRSNNDVASPYFVRVSVYPTVQAARAALPGRPGATQGWEAAVVSQTPNEIVLFIDRAPGTEFADSLARVALAGRFIVIAMCAQNNAVGVQAALQTCATAVSNAQAQKLTPFQPQPKKKKKS